MPGYKMHVGFSMCIFFLLCIFFLMRISPSLFLLGELFCVMLLGALFPDIDIKSKGQKYIYTLLFMCMIPCMFMGYFTVVALCVWISLVPMMVRHRGIFHDPLWVIVFTVSLWYIVYVYNNVLAQKAVLHTLFFMIGAQSHILLDYGCVRYARKLLRLKTKKSWRSGG